MSNYNSRGFFRLVFRIYDTTLIGHQNTTINKIHDFIESHCITNHVYMRSSKQDRLIRKSHWVCNFYICAEDSEVVDLLEAYMDDFPYLPSQVALVEIYKGEDYNNNYLLWWSPSVGFMQEFWDKFKDTFRSCDFEKAHKLICKLLEP